MYVEKKICDCDSTVIMYHENIRRIKRRYVYDRWLLVLNTGLMCSTCRSTFQASSNGDHHQMSYCINPVTKFQILLTCLHTILAEVVKRSC